MASTSEREMTGSTHHRGQTCRFDLGQLKCAAISDGSTNYPLGNVFANVPAAQVEEALAQHGFSVDVVTTPCPVLYVETGQDRLLVDLGAGSGQSHLNQQPVETGLWRAYGRASTCVDAKQGCDFNRVPIKVRLPWAPAAAFDKCGGRKRERHCSSPKSVLS